MYLSNFKIISNDEIIRDVGFHNGVNLILDTTPSNKISSESGNNVGKTTFIRAIDFCLGSKSSILIKDKEQQTDNIEVKDFLIKNKVVFELTIKQKNGEKIKLSRSLIDDHDLYIDNKKFKNITNYTSKLNEIFFDLKDSKISFRNIIKKFVRSDEFSDSNILKVLSKFSDANVYESMYLYLFGFPKPEIIDQRFKITEALKKLNQSLKKIKGKSELPKLEARLKELDLTIAEKEKIIKSFNLPKTYDDLLNKLHTIKTKSTSLSDKISNLNFKISLSEKSLNELKESESNIDPKTIHNLYEEAKLFIPTIQKSFEEVLEFHNQMVSNKISFVSKHIDKLKSQKENLQTEIKPILEEQASIISLLDNTGTFDDLIKVREDINIYYTDKGKLLSKIEEINGLNMEIQKNEELFEEINEEFKTYLDEMNENISNIFNKYLKKYTHLTHDEEIYLLYDSDSRKFEFDNLKGNVGDGYKKTDILSFDFAFIKYFEKLQLNFPRFVINDKLEIIHRNQMKYIFEIADGLDGQFIAPLLKERISYMGEDYIKSKTILKLSEKEKLFKF